MRPYLCDDGQDPAAKKPDRATSGFTLIEVLIALAIVAIALGAVLRAMGALSTNTETARARMLALWSADNSLSALRITRTWPETGQTIFPCPQGQYQFICRQTVATVTASALLREVSVSVYLSTSSRAVLAEAVTVIQDEPPN